MKRLAAAALALAALAPMSALADGHMPNLEGREVVIVTENAYPPLQFVDPSSGEPVGWEYDAMEIIAERLNITVVYETISWDAMIAAVSEGQFDMGMTGITIREDRAEVVDFSDSYMTSQMRMLVRAGETGKPVGKIQEQMGVPASTLSHHIRTLELVDLVNREKAGTTHYCRANYGVMDAVIGYLSEECCVESDTNNSQ